MHALPEKRTAAPTGIGNRSENVLATDSQTYSPQPLDLQAFRIRARFGLSWSAARAVAVLAYGGQHDH
ncbi:hypothetical protein GGE12_005054 [Rhizobium mongolense]|uniref:Uncharacterized protein n=1 Tax=Rhizobium mongolense TaxID=57676 RepID=A0A7W6WGH3_9HYPH|nr:hypothetical protein [Rhizobium mongolense]